MISNEKMSRICFFMEYDIMEEMHYKYAPCSNEEFLFHYFEAIEGDKREEFEKALEDEFDITFVDICDNLWLVKEGEEIRKNIEGHIVEMEKIYELELLQCVSSVVNQGHSGNMIGYYRYEVELVNGDTFTVYCKGEMEND